MNRLLIALAGVVVAAVLFVIFRPGDDNESSSPPPPPPPAPTASQSTSTPTQTRPRPQAEPQAARVQIVVRGGKPVGGIKRATVAKNKRVILTVRSDVADEVHVHGYDLMKDVAPGAPAVISFKATIPGRFEAELEQRGLQIAELTVKP